MIQKFLKDESGLDLTEAALIIVVIILAVIAASVVLGVKIKPVEQISNWLTGHQGN